MTKRRGPGRPRLPKGKAKGAVLSIRLTPAERELLDALADDEGSTVSEWARATLLHAATGEDKT